MLADMDQMMTCGVLSPALASCLLSKGILLQGRWKTQQDCERRETVWFTHSGMFGAWPNLGDLTRTCFIEKQLGRTIITRQPQCCLLSYFFFCSYRCLVFKFFIILQTLLSKAAYKCIWKAKLNIKYQVLTVFCLSSQWTVCNQAYQAQCKATRSQLPGKVQQYLTIVHCSKTSDVISAPSNTVVVQALARKWYNNISNTTCSERTNLQIK